MRDYMDHASKVLLAVFYLLGFILPILLAAVIMAFAVERMGLSNLFQIGGGH